MKQKNRTLVLALSGALLLGGAGSVRALSGDQASACGAILCLAGLPGCRSREELAFPELVASGRAGDLGVAVQSHWFSVGALCPWAEAGDYWGVFFDFHKNCKEAFDAAGIEIPFPQRVVHMQKSVD